MAVQGALRTVHARLGARLRIDGGTEAFLWTGK